LDFAATIAFLILYYIRPQEWISGVALLWPVTVVIGVALLATFTRKSGFNFREVFKTPHDWLMLAYFLWIVGTAPNPLTALGGLYNLFVFYWVTVLALSSLERIRVYLWCWAGLLFTLAALAVASEHGFDPMGGWDVTHGEMQGRLSLGTGIFCNPNALGHSVVPVLLMLYFLVVWQRPVFACLPAIPLLALPAWCVYLTFSKGAYLSGFANGLISLCLGRPRLVQVWILAGALSVGVAGLKQLPRMSAMDNTRRDEGIRRRENAFQFGYSAMCDHLTGLGYGKFLDRIQPVFREMAADPHSSYVHVGAEFGRPGLFLFCGLLYACYRTVLTARTTSIEEERVRRVLLVLLISYTASSWMIDWTTMAHFWLIVAAIAAFHRYLVEKEKAPALAQATADGVVVTLPAKPPEPDTGMVATRLKSAPAPGKQRIPVTEEALAPFWNRLRLLDLGMIGGLTLLTMLFWRYVMMNV
jgi:O-antigen ligase